MANTPGVQYTRTHLTAHVSQQRSETILNLKKIRKQVEDGMRSHMSQGLQVGIVRRKHKFLSTVVSEALSLRMFVRERITESEEVEKVRRS